MKITIRTGSTEYSPDQPFKPCFGSFKVIGRIVVSANRLTGLSLRTVKLYARKHGGRKLLFLRAFKFKNCSDAHAFAKDVTTQD